jgi:histone deacetylase 6
MLTERVIMGELTNGFAIVRPPGHHAEANVCCGFCIFNNVAVAAAAAKSKHGLERILIVDWDVHHGNGTQHMFEDDPSVLYFSVHRYDDGDFFPHSKDAAPQVVGCGTGRGFNVNVAWNIPWKDKIGMGDDEYLAAWQCLLLPIAREFQPQLILVSAGFDCAAGDLGGCSVTPGGFAQMTRMLQSICPKVVLMLEGRYDLGIVPQCALACVQALLGDPLRFRTDLKPRKEALLSIERTFRAQRPFWKCLAAHGCSESGFENLLTMDVPAGCSNSLKGCRDAIPTKNKKGNRTRQGKDKPVPGVSIATRNAALSNWKNDVKKLERKQTELETALSKVSALKRDATHGTRLSKKDAALLETEDDLHWRLKEIACELQELSLSQVETIRMYAGCR